MHESGRGLQPRAPSCPPTHAQVFRCIARTPNKEFLLRLSMMEIYNEVGCTDWAVLVCSLARHDLDLKMRWALYLFNSCVGLYWECTALH